MSIDKQKDIPVVTAGNYDFPKRAITEEYLVEVRKVYPIKKAWWRRVLNKVNPIPIIDLIIITLAPKPIIIMWKWIKDRLKEPSTYQGVTVLTSAIGLTLSPELWESIVTLAGAVIGLIQVIKKEQNKNDSI